jgi:hypothetical protein
MGLLLSPEWSDRLGTGHVMILGLCAWPAMMAALLAASEERETTGTRRLLWAALAGGILGLASLGGGHYPVVFGMFLAGLLVWARHSPWQYQAGLIGLCALPLISLEGGGGLRPLLELGAVGLGVIGIVRGARVRSAALNLLGFTLGLCAISGALLTVSANRAAEVGRLGFPSLQAPPWQPQPLALLLEGQGGELETFLDLPHPLLWLLLIGGMFALLRKCPPLLTAGLVFLLLAWTLGRPLRIWTPLTLSPGMMAADSQMRMQWLVLLLGPLGLAASLSWMTERLPTAGGKRIAHIVLAGLLLFWGVRLYSLPNAGMTSPEEIFPVAFGQVERVADPSGVYSASSIGGAIIPDYYSDPESIIFRRPPGLEQALHWSSKEGRVAPSPGGVSVGAVLGTWTIRAPPGTRVVLAQKDLPGWSCDGGRLDPDLQRIAHISALLDNQIDRSPGRGRWWLSVRVGPSGEATCSWRPERLTLGLWIQALACLALLGLAGLWIRRTGVRAPSDC